MSVKNNEKGDFWHQNFIKWGELWRIFLMYFDRIFWVLKSVKNWRISKFCTETGQNWLIRSFLDSIWPKNLYFLHENSNICYLSTHRKSKMSNQNKNKRGHFWHQNNNKWGELWHQNKFWRIFCSPCHPRYGWNLLLCSHSSDGVP